MSFLLQYRGPYLDFWVPKSNVVVHQFYLSDDSARVVNCIWLPANICISPIPVLKLAYVTPHVRVTGFVSTEMQVRTHPMAYRVMWSLIVPSPWFSSILSYFTLLFISVKFPSWHTVLLRAFTIWSFRAWHSHKSSNLIRCFGTWHLRHILLLRCEFATLVLTRSYLLFYYCAVFRYSQLWPVLLGHPILVPWLGCFEPRTISNC